MTALTLYAAAYHPSSPSLTTATATYIIANAGTPSNTWAHHALGSATAWGEVTTSNQPAAWDALASPPTTPTGWGFLYNSTALENQYMLAGNWSANVRLNLDTGTVPAAGTYGGLTPGTVSITGTIRVRVYIWHGSSNTYTLIGALTDLTAQTISGSYVTYAIAATSLAASPTFGSGDKLYYDIWVNVTTGQSGDTTASMRVNRLSTDTIGLTGDTNEELVTPGYAQASLIGQAAMGAQSPGGLVSTAIQTLAGSANMGASTPGGLVGSAVQLVGGVAYLGNTTPGGLVATASIVPSSAVMGASTPGGLIGSGIMAIVGSAVMGSSTPGGLAGSGAVGNTTPLFTVKRAWGRIYARWRYPEPI